MLNDAKPAGESPAAVSNARFSVRALLSFVLIGSALALAGCGNTRGGKIPYEVQLAEPDRPVAVALGDDYRIGPLDTLKIAVFQVPDLSGEFEVDLTGNVALPLVGNVKAIDLTPSELDQRLTAKLGEKYLQSPDVTVGVKTSSTRVVTVDGSVRSPGVFPANQPLTLMQVIAMAKGTDENANPRRIAIFRQIQGQRMAAAFDLTSIRRGEMEDPKVYSGDIVVVSGTKTKALYQQILGNLPLLAAFRPF
jgi:polysaccharide export outer membrane protein